MEVAKKFFLKKIEPNKFDSILYYITLPETGKYKSETVFTASTLPNTPPAFKSSSTVSTSTKTMSPNSL